MVSPSNPGRATLEVGNESWPLPLPLVTDRRQVGLRREGRPRRDSVPARRRQRTRRDRSLPRVRRGAERVRPRPARDSGVRPVRPAHHQHAGEAGRPVLEERRRQPGRPGQRAGGQGDRGGLQRRHVVGVPRLLLSGAEGPGPGRAPGPDGLRDRQHDDWRIRADRDTGGIWRHRRADVHRQHDGVVYQKDLGPDSLTLAKKIDRYNPDKTWRRTTDGWPKG